MRRDGIVILQPVLIESDQDLHCGQDSKWIINEITVIHVLHMHDANSELVSKTNLPAVIRVAWNWEYV